MENQNVGESENKEKSSTFYDKVVTENANIVMLFFLACGAALLIIISFIGIIGVVCNLFPKPSVLEILHGTEYFLIAPLPFISIYALGKINNINIANDLPITYNTAKATFFSSVIGLVILELATGFISYHEKITSFMELFLYSFSGVCIVLAIAVIYYIITNHKQANAGG